MLTTPIISHIFQLVVPTVEEIIVETASTTTNKRNVTSNTPPPRALCMTVCVFYVMYFIALHSFVFFQTISNFLLLRTILNTAY
jgi:hypothetical protein